MPNYADSIDVARHIIEFDPVRSGSAGGTLFAAVRGLPLEWPSGLEPQPSPLANIPLPGDPLPRADVLIVTWTVAEVQALADVLTPGYESKRWYLYDRGFRERYADSIRKGAPALKVSRLGSYFKTKVGTKQVLCFKSELHLNQDGKPIDGQPGNATLPVRELWAQILAEVEPQLVITTGTAGATFPDHQLGDVMVTTAARFRLNKEFKNAPFNGQEYHSSFHVPLKHIQGANELMRAYGERLKEPDFGPPTKKYPFPQGLIPAPKNTPDVKLAGRDMPVLPVLTTDYFEYGTSGNRLELEGCAVEMGDAVLGLVASDLGRDAPAWVVVRNASDPQINADLPTEPRSQNMQIHWAVWYYETYGYWTSVNSAIASWAVIAGL